MERKILSDLGQVLLTEFWKLRHLQVSEFLPFLVISMPDRAQSGQKTESYVAIRKAPSLFLVMRTLEGDLSSSRLRAEHLKGAQAGCCPRFDAELFEDLKDMFFYCRFAIPKNGCDLAIGLTLGKPQ